MKRIAITGNIGSGKSWVCELFKQHLNIPVYNSDEAAKRMYFLPEVRQQLVQRFGDGFYISDNEIVCLTVCSIPAAVLIFSSI